jgi:hypothetical protein
MDDRKWGSVDPDDFIPLDPENVSEWYDVLSLVAHTFERAGYLEDVSYNLITDRVNVYSVQVQLLQLSEFSPDRAWELAVEIKRGLRRFKHFWLVQIGFLDPDPGVNDGLIWIEIDKYRVNPRPGMVITNRFQSMAEFFRKYWGTDFGFPP